MNEPNSRAIRLSRRALLVAGAGVAVGACTGSGGQSDSTSSVPPAGSTEPPTGSSATESSPTTVPVLAEAPAYEGGDPFTLGIASGDPDAASFVLWTRLLPSDGPAQADDQDVAWDIARSDDFEDLVASGLTTAPAQYASSVHLIVGDLEPNSWYFYRFRLGEHTSTIGRARTTPAADSLDQLRFGFSSCQYWETGAYAAHRFAAELDDLDLFVWLGDYIYEYGPNERGVRTESAGLRVHDSPEVVDLDGYRARYALYKSDPHLQASHAARPWVVVWDDHEVDNNYAGADAEDGQTIEQFEARTLAAHQAWWEHMPVRIDPPDGGRLTIYRNLKWGELVDLYMLDGRQYRDPPAIDGEPVLVPGVGDVGLETLGPTALDSDFSMLGDDQETWLVGSIASSSSAWTVLGNQVYMHGINALPGDSPAINTDTWDGYFGNRARLLREIDRVKGGDLVVLSGDFHSSTAAALRPDPFNIDVDIVGTEFMAPAISSQFPEGLRDLAPLALALNPQVVDFSIANGLMVCTVTSESWVTQRVDVVDHRDENSEVRPTKRFTVLPGAPGEIRIDDVVTPYQAGPSEDS